MCKLLVVINKFLLTMKILNDNGDEIEVFTADEVTARVTARETEFNTEKAALTGQLTEAQQALKERAGEFAQFRKLSDDAVSKLSIAEKTIYENGLAIHDQIEKNKVLEATILGNQVDSSIKNIAGTDEKLVAEVKKMWGLVGIEANTPETIEQKTRMILGMISVATPDLVATVQGFSGGSFKPPETKKVEGNSQVSVERITAGAKELGLDPKALGITQ